MVELGKFNTLTVIKQVPFGMYLQGGHLGEVLLPSRYCPDDIEIGSEVEVFLYLDSDDLPIATTEKPKATVGQCAYLKVVDINKAGAFLDWGLSKDLLVPYSEQHKPFELGRSYVVCIYLDAAQDRITASSKLSRHLQEFSQYFKAHQKVELLICGKSELGCKAVINHTHLGLIYKDELFKPLNYGQRLDGFIKALRDDGKINLSIQPHAAKGRDELCERILAHLREREGVSHLTDKSTPEDIHREFNVSKSNYKKALGRLYKDRLVELGTSEVKLI